MHIRIFTFIIIEFLFGVAISGAEEYRLTTHPSYDYHARWSPDGETIMFTSQRSGRPQIYTIPAIGGSINLVPTGIIGDHYCGWHPDGDKIVFDAYLDDEPPPEIYLFYFADSTVVNLTNTPTGEGHPCISYDGNFIIYSDGDIWRMNLDGTGAERLIATAYDEYHPAVSPDGNQIAFVRDYGDNPDIVVYNLLTKEEQRITTYEGFDNQPVWSPDGTKIAFTSDRSGRRQIHLIDVVTSELVRIETSYIDSWPFWSPDGTKIAFSSIRSGNMDIWVTDAPVFFCAVMLPVTPILIF